MSSAVTHIGFADESHWNKGRFRSLGLVTLPLNCLEFVESEVRRLLSESQVSFAWMCSSGTSKTAGIRSRGGTTSQISGACTTTCFVTCSERVGRMMLSGGFAPTSTLRWIGKPCRTVSRM